MLIDSFTKQNISLKTRLVFPPIGTHSARDDGTVSEKTQKHYEGICRDSNIGLAYVEHCYVEASGKAYQNQISLADDSVIPGIATLADCMKIDGTKAFLQLNHCGSLSSAKDIGMQPISASTVRAPKSKETPREMTKEEIERISGAFAAAALRVKQAGFDGVEIHAAHSYLFNQFYSPITNHRIDEYGGSRENRLRFLCETILQVRKAVGAEFPISVRLGACDYMKGGITPEDGVYAAKKLEKLGVDLLSITGGLCQFTVPELMKKRAYFEELAKAIVSEVKIPVLLTGGITDTKVAEAILRDGSADLIGVGRSILKDADWARQIE